MNISIPSKWFLRFAVTLCCCAGQTAHAAHFWVDVKASASGDGSSEQPFATIQQAARIAGAGDTVHVRAGVYRERVVPEHGGEPGKSIKYVSESLHAAIIKGSDPWQPAWRDEGDGVYSGELPEAHFTDTNYVDGGNPYCIVYYFEQERSHRPPHPFTNVSWTLGQVFLDEQPLVETSSREELARTRNVWRFDATTGRIQINLGGQRPHGRNWEIATRRGVFRPLRKGLGYIELHGFVFAHCANQFPGTFWARPANAQSGMVGTRSGHHWVISNNVFRHAKSIGLTFGTCGFSPQDGRPYDNELPGQSDPPAGTIGFHHIEGNLFVGNGAIGAMGFQHTGVVFQRNVFTENNLLANTSYETGGIKTHAAHAMIVAENWFLDNECMGVWLDNTWKSCRLTRNVFSGNRGKDVFFEMDNNNTATASLVDHNLFLPGRPELAVSSSESTARQPWRPWAVGVYGHDADGVRITRNLFAGEGYGLYFRKITNRKGGAADLRATGNLFAGSKLTAVCLPLENPPLVQGNEFEANLYSSGRRAFAATGWSLATGGADKPSLEKIRKQIPAAASLPFGDPAKPPAGYYLNLEQWRMVMACDRSSRDADCSCTFDRTTGKLQLNIPEAALLLTVPAEAGLDADFFGRPIAVKAHAGPFGTLEAGVQYIQLSMPVPLPSKWSADEQTIGCGR
jgi:hypothetical protein